MTPRISGFCGGRDTHGIARGDAMPPAPAISPTRVRRTLHATHAAATLALLATGLFLEFPELRSVAVGGYGHRIASIHLFAGASFVVLPLVALALARSALIEDLRLRLGPPDPWRWRKSHIVSSLVAVTLLSLSGIVMWTDERLPSAVGDAARLAHVALTVLIGASLCVHLVVARRKIVARVRRSLGRDEDPDGFFELDEDLDQD
jgi:cytochrome b subunit of formate dehydrogenase